MPSRKARSKSESLWRRPELIIAVALVVLTLAVYLRALGNQFLLFDDNNHVTRNDMVLRGVNSEGIRWAFSTFETSNWHPLTWISHMLDVSLFDMEPLGHHLTSVLLHLANTLLLFWVLCRLTKSSWRSGFVAALFAIHPLHVESVAWVSERKDVLSTFFWMLTMLAYVRYVEKPTFERQLLVIIPYGLGLLAKPMLVTLPLMLLLLDYWPLRRMNLFREKSLKNATSMLRLFLEKLPLFVLSAASCFMTYRAQTAGHAVAQEGLLPLGVRIANALVSYVSYIAKTFWPARLAGFYPHPDKTIPGWQVIGSALIMIAVTILVIRALRSRPHLAVGWLWYVGTLVPVIGLIQVGSQAMADRYTYIPLIGLSVAVTWLVPELLRPISPSPRLLVAIAGAVILALAAAAWVQVGYWHDDYALSRRAIAVTKDNYTMHQFLGFAYQMDGKYDEAVREYKEVVRILPTMVHPHNNLALIYYRQGRFADAWNEVHRCRELGYEPSPIIIQRLSEVMPEPRETTALPDGR